MRTVHYILCAILVVFALLQYNDPDWYYWGPVYLLAAGWSGLAAREPRRFLSWPIARYGAPVCVALFVIGFASLASTIKSDWIHIEEAREAFGYLICAATTAMAFWTSRQRTSA